MRLPRMLLLSLIRTLRAMTSFEWPVGDEEIDALFDEESDPARVDLQREARELSHLLTHIPKNKWCLSCTRAKMQRKPCRSHRRREPKFENFGDQVTADHIVMSEPHSSGVGFMKYALTIYDRATKWLQCQPLMDKTAETAAASLRHFLGEQVCRSLWTDNAGELVSAAKQLGILHGRATPYRPETNGVAERANRTVLEGARTILDAAGLPPRYWPFALPTFCFLQNVNNNLLGAAWQCRHGEPFPGSLIPLAALWSSMPNGKTKDDLPKMAPRTLPGIMLGYFEQPGGKWSGEYVVGELQHIAAHLASTDVDTPFPTTYRVKEVIVPPSAAPVLPIEASL
jgi:hypothetical protein